MTVEVERDALLAALRQVAGVVASRNTIAVLGNLLLIAEGGSLTVTGTDLDQTACARVDAAGSIKTTVDKEKLLAAVASFKAGRLTIDSVEGRAAVTIKQGRGVRTLPTLSPNDFPQLREPEGAVTFEVAGGVLSRLLEATHVAQCTDETRYYLQGVFMHVVDGKLRAAAADGFRMVRAEAEAPEGAVRMPGIIVPTKAVGHLRTLLSKVESAVTVVVTETIAVFRIGDPRLATKLVEGTFPDYERTIPAKGGTILSVKRDQLIDAPAAVVSVVNAEGDKFKVRGVAIDLTQPDGPEVAARDQAGNAATEPLELVVTGDAIRFGVNQKFLAQAAGIFAAAATITLSIADPAAPMRLESDKDADLIAVIMPMRA